MGMVLFQQIQATEYKKALALHGCLKKGMTNIRRFKVN
jgi:hypothetical protein